MLLLSPKVYNGRIYKSQRDDVQTLLKQNISSYKTNKIDNFQSLQG